MKGYKQFLDKEAFNSDTTNLKVTIKNISMKTLVLNYLPTNYNTLSIKDKKYVIESIKIEIQKSKDNLTVLNS